jgi:predicted metal-dependent hydrolase
MNGRTANANAVVCDGEGVFFLGRRCRLEVSHAVWSRVALDGETLRVTLCNTSDAARIRKLVDGWLLEQARQTLPGLFAAALERHGWRIRRPRVPLVPRSDAQPDGLRLTVRRMRSRWGSCSVDGRITLGAELLQLPHRLIEYVVVHELCHLAHPNHAPAFWFQVATCLPDWRQRRGELKAWQRRTGAGCR